jgi:peptide/nickel transport system substrate-binding protein
MTRLSRRGFLVSGTALASGAMSTGIIAVPALAQADLPPLEDRLPENPLVVTPTDRPAKQGGTWNHALVGGGSLSMIWRYQAYEPLYRFDPQWTGIIPNVAESYEVSDDSREYTITLRRGHKWSDGEPYTTEDVRFWYEDVFLDEDAPLGERAFWYSGDEVARL